MEKSRCNPIVLGVRLTKDEKGDKINATMCKQLIGSLTYLTATRPNLMHVVSLMSRFMASPTELHLQPTKRVLRYLKGTIDLGILYRKRGNGELIAYTDSDHAGDIGDRKSTSGYVFLLNDEGLSWSPKRQPVVTLYTTEAEFVVAASCACQGVWMRRVLEKLGHFYPRIQSGMDVANTLMRGSISCAI
ncbi:uncharacterized protein LOC111778766 [Cucurbita pepo subsp. pepo]|uniref:uncharacterized protein LOC111778766 n=1 Tax=Cucurbita pepo subsp. pepo TaxID=3664 RepID=UPI000C9D6344|nr:uncharacterized protein LOC111778766 [Cucurbita pepo subsp. pepo]